MAHLQRGHSSVHRHVNYVPSHSTPLVSPIRTFAAANHSHPQFKRCNVTQPRFTWQDLCSRLHAAAVEAEPSTAAAPSQPEADAPAVQVPLSFQHRPGLYDSNGKLLLKNLTLPELEEWCASLGEPAKRARQLWRFLYANHRWGRALSEADDSTLAFSNAFKRTVEASASLSGGLTMQSMHVASDGTRKIVYSLHGDEGASGTVETVLIPMTNKAGQNMRYTACVSSQVGCAMNCQFCFTGRMGLLGNLNTAQIVEQVVEARRMLHAEGSSVPIHNIVFMGMGEPFHNYEAVTAAVQVMTEPEGLQLSKNKVIVSTVGLVPEIRAFRESGIAKLAVSLHATTDEIRSWVVPVNRKYPLAELMGTLTELYPPIGSDSHRRTDDFVVLEYVMLKGVNDTQEDAARLLELTRDMYCMINLIVFNPHEGTQFQRSSDDDVRAFRRVLVDGGKVCTVRFSKGDDEMAACGQLGNPGLSDKKAPILKPPTRLRAVFGAETEGTESQRGGAAEAVAP